MTLKLSTAMLWRDNLIIHDSNDLFGSYFKKKKKDNLNPKYSTP